MTYTTDHWYKFVVLLKEYSNHYITFKPILHGGNGAVLNVKCETMSQIRLEPPAMFNFRTPDEWLRWRSHYEQFWFASGLFDDDPK